MSKLNQPSIEEREAFQRQLEQRVANLNLPANHAQAVLELIGQLIEDMEAGISPVKELIDPDTLIPPEDDGTDAERIRDLKKRFLQQLEDFQTDLDEKLIQHLLSHLDHMVWTVQFIKILQARPELLDQPRFIADWFCNAIMTEYDRVIQSTPEGQ